MLSRLTENIIIKGTEPRITLKVARRLLLGTEAGFSVQTSYLRLLSSVGSIIQEVVERQPEGSNLHYL